MPYSPKLYTLLMHMLLRKGMQQALYWHLPMTMKAVEQQVAIHLTTGGMPGGAPDMHVGLMCAFAAFAGGAAKTARGMREQSGGVHAAFALNLVESSLLLPFTYPFGTEFEMVNAGKAQAAAASSLRLGSSASVCTKSVCHN